jgi:hypothetical protein
LGRLATSFVLEYHGCTTDVAKKVVNGLMSLSPSDKPYDWLGPGIYFWEADSLRAKEWAVVRCKASGGEPAVLGAVIDLGNCLDLLSRPDQDTVRLAFESLKAIYDKAGTPLPKNENSSRGGDFDRRLRKLDCAIIKHLPQAVCAIGEDDAPPFDSVRGMFTEGQPIYQGSGFHAQSHVQISVRDERLIKGYFLPPELKQSFTD